MSAPIAVVIYREDHRFMLDPIIPHPGRTEANFDLDHRLAALPG